MSKYLAESIASCVRAEQNIVTDLLKSMEVFEKSGVADYRSRVYQEAIDKEKLVEEFTAWLSSTERARLFACCTKKEERRLVIMGEPVLLKYITAQYERDLLSEQMSASIGILDVRFSKIFAVVMESETAIGKGYAVMQAWTNVTAPELTLAKAELLGE